MKIKLSVNKKIINKNKIQKYMGYLDGYYRLSVNDFVNKVIKKGYSWTGGKFKNNHRHKKNFIQSEIIGIDVDEGTQLNKIFNDKFTQENALLLYTSTSHSKSNHRFRIVFKLPEPIKNSNEIEQIIKKLIKYYNSDSNCSDCSRIFYGNTNAKVKVFGKTLTDKQMLDTTLEQEESKAIHSSQLKSLYYVVSSY